MTPARRVRSKVPRCSFPDCKKQVQTRKLCKAHGGGVRCRGPDCTKLAQSRGLALRTVADAAVRSVAVPSWRSPGVVPHSRWRSTLPRASQKFVQLKGRCKAHAKALARSDDAQPILKNAGSKFSIAFLVNPLESPVLPSDGDDSKLCSAVDR